MATAATAAPLAAPPTLIGSVQRALRLLEAAASHSDGAPAKQLAREAGLPLPTAYHLLRTLTHEGYLRREKGVFVLGAAAGGWPEGQRQQNRRSMIEDSLAHWRDAIGVPVYFAVYREGEIELVGVADTPGTPAVEEWADFRETGHAHAIGQCLLGQLDERGPQRSSRPPSRAGDHPLFRARPARAAGTARALGRMQPVVERQEYALGTVCAAIPITAGSAAATMAISLPSTRKIGCCPRSNNYAVVSGGCWGHSRSLSVSEKSLLVICCALTARFVKRAMGIIPGRFHGASSTAGYLMRESVQAEVLMSFLVSEELSFRIPVELTYETGIPMRCG